MTPPFRTHDRHPTSELPEHAVVRDAIDALAHAANHADIEMAQHEFESMLTDIARNLLASDFCEQCDDNDGPSCSPHTLEPCRDDDGTLKATYRCRNGHEWTCYWAANARGFFAELG